MGDLRWCDAVTEEQKQRLADEVLPPLRDLMANPKLRDLVDGLSIMDWTDINGSWLLLDTEGLYVLAPNDGFFALPGSIKKERVQPDAATAARFNLEPWHVEDARRQLER